jgi:hypothetical protein
MCCCRNHTVGCFCGIEVTREMNMTQCICGSTSNICIGEKIYCSGCFDAGVKFGIKNAEKIQEINKEIARMGLEKGDGGG